MAPHDMHRFSDRRNRRVEKRKRKKAKHSLVKPLLHRNAGGQHGRDLSKHPKNKQHGGQRNRFSAAENHSSEKIYLNGDASPPPIVLGSQKRVRQNVEFVYPRGANHEVRPYVFDRHSQVPAENGDGPAESKDAATADKTSKETIVTAESIEDILFPNKRHKEQKQPNDARESEARSGNVRPDRDSYKKESSSELPIKKTQLNDTNLSSSGKKRDRDHQSVAPAETNDGWGGQLSGLSVADAVRDKVGSRPRSNSTDGELKLPRRGLCDEHMVLESHKWKHASRTKSPLGLVNLGNTCFLNATLQCLAYLPTFCQCITSVPGQNVVTGKVSKGQKMMTMLRTLLRQVHNVDGSGGSNHHAIAPRAIVNAVPTIGGKSYKFRPGRQEDAHEFLVHLLDAMKDGELKAAGVDQRMSGWRERLPIPRLDETTLIHRIFGGYLRSQVRCTACGYRSNTYDPFLDLALEVSKKSSNSIASAFSEFTRKETLDSANQWKCSGCKKYVCATKQLTVFRPPLTLCIQLKRFTFGGGFGGYSCDFGHYGKFGSGRKGGSKISKPIEFPANLKLPLSDGRRCEYALTGIVIHVGGSASSGHYTAYVRKPCVGGGSQWYHMDDSFVEAVSEKTVLKQRDAYVLFYCRKEVKLPIPEPPPRGAMSACEAREHGVARARARTDSTTSDDAHPQVVAPAKATKHEAAKLSAALAFPCAQSPEAHTKKTKSTPENLHIKKTKVNSPVADDSGDESSSSSSSSCSTSVSDEGDRGSEDESKMASSSVLGNSAPCSSSPVNASSSLYSATEGNGTMPLSTAASQSNELGKPPPLSDTGKQTLGTESPAADSTKGSTASDSSSSSSSSDSSSDSDSTTSSSGTDSESHTPSSSPEKSVATVSLPSDSILMEPKESDKDLNSTKKGGTGRFDKGKQSESVPEHRNEAKTKVVLDRGKSRGKLEVMLGPRYKSKAWKPKTLLAEAGDMEEQHLLGNMVVAKWDDDDEPKTEAMTNASELRDNAVRQMKKQETSRKRQMHLDRWDAALDEGKRKKVKATQKSEPVVGSVDPKKNPYHRIQSSIQRMNRGRAKGYFRQHDKSNRPTHGHHFKRGGR